MIEITDAAAEKLLMRQVEGKVVKLFKTSQPGELPTSHVEDLGVGATGGS